MHSTSARIYAHHKVRIIGKMTQLRGEGESLSSPKVFLEDLLHHAIFLLLFFIFLLYKFHYIHTAHSSVAHFFAEVLSIVSSSLGCRADITNQREKRPLIK